MEPTNNNKYSSDPIIKSVELEAELMEFFNQFENIDIPLYWSETHEYKHPVNGKQVKTEVIRSAERNKPLQNSLHEFFKKRLESEFNNGCPDKRTFINEEMEYLSRFTDLFSKHIALKDYKTLLENKKTEKNRFKPSEKTFKDYLNANFPDNIKDEIIEVLQNKIKNPKPTDLTAILIELYKIGFIDPMFNPESAYKKNLSNAICLIFPGINPETVRTNLSQTDRMAKSKFDYINTNLNIYFVDYFQYL